MDTPEYECYHCKFKWSGSKDTQGRLIHSNHCPSCKNKDYPYFTRLNYHEGNLDTKR